MFEIIANNSQLLPIDLMMVSFVVLSFFFLFYFEDEGITLTYPSVTDGADEMMLMIVVDAAAAAFDHDEKLMMDSKANYGYQLLLDCL